MEEETRDSERPTHAVAMGKFCMKCRVLYLDSKAVLLNLWIMAPLCQRTLLQGLPKTIFHIRYLYYYS